MICRFFTNAIWVMTLFLTILPVVNTFGSEFDNRLKSLQNKAMFLKLAQDPYWIKLLHYEGSPGAYVSPVNNATFFLSEEGKTNATEELKATIAAFLKPVGSNHNQHAQCRFIARYHWLKSRLPDLQNATPAANCSDYKKWYQMVQPESLSLVFASSFFGNPASVYGHLFIKINRPGPAQEMDLSSYVIQYAARTDASFGITYIFRGVFGGFSGFFSATELHTLIKTNLELEDRDLWEYRLNPGQQAVDRVMRHYWELKEVEFDYYFFLQNCAYRLVELIETAWDDPNRQPIEKQKFIWAIPGDILQEIIQSPDFVSQRLYIPSRSSRFRQKLEKLSDGERSWVHRCIENPDSADSKEFNRLGLQSQVMILDTANDYFRIVINSRLGQIEILDKWFQYRAEQDIARKKRKKLLLIRSKLKMKPIVIKSKPPAPPESSHGSARMGIATGHLNKDRGFVELTGWASYHDILSNPDGYLPYSQLKTVHFSIVSTEIRSQPRLRYLHIVDVLALSVRDDFFKPKSWRIQIGVEELTPKLCSDCLVFNAAGNIGVAIETKWLSTELFYLLPGISIQMSETFDNNYRLAGSIMAGGLFNWNDSIRTDIRLLADSTLAGDSFTRHWGHIRNRFKITKNLETRLEFEKKEQEEYLVGILWSF